MVRSNSNQLRIIAGKWRGRKILFIDQEDLRPTPDRVRETLFNWLQAELTDSVCLDLFAGSGALGFEAASRGAKQVVMVDSSNKICELIRKNISSLKAKTIEAIASDAVFYLDGNNIKFDIVFLDPPYKSELLSLSITLLEQKKCLAEHAKIYIEHDAKQNLPELPVNWQVLKTKSAGQVSYYLIDRTS